MTRGLARHFTAVTFSAALEARTRLARLFTVTIDWAGLNTSLASCAVLLAVSLAVLVTHEVCCTVLLTFPTVAVLVALFFSSDYHLLAATKLWSKWSGKYDYNNIIIYIYIYATVRFSWCFAIEENSSGWRVSVAPGITLAIHLGHAIHKLIL